MSAADRSPSARQLTERLTNIIYHLHDQLDPLKRAALTEACRRLQQHEALVRDVLPDLRRQVTKTSKGEVGAALTGPDRVPKPFTGRG